MDGYRPEGAASVTQAPSPAAADNLWLHFAEMHRYSDRPAPVIVRGEGAHVYDDTGRRYLDALASLYCVNAGYGRQEIVDAVAAQMATLPYFTTWNYANLPALALSERIAGLAPGDLNRVFFTSGGSESVDSAWKMVRQYHRLRGNPGKVKVVSRAGAYHGTTLGALSIGGIPSIQAPFAPLLENAANAPAVNPYRAGVDPVTHSVKAAEAVRAIVESEGPETVGGIIVEPVQNSGGCLVAEPEHFARLRAICDDHDLLLISDETICSWGRLGTWFGCQRYDYQPDIVTTAKGLTSAYVPMGAVIASDRVAEPFFAPETMFAHGLTFGGHPVAAAAALSNLDIIEREDLCGRADEMGAELRGALESLRDIPIVGDVRGAGLFMAIELVADQTTREPLPGATLASMAARVPGALFQEGVICRAMHRGAPLIQFAPPLIIERADVDEIERALRVVLTRVAREV